MKEEKVVVGFFCENTEGFGRFNFIVPVLGDSIIRSRDMMPWVNKSKDAVVYGSHKGVSSGGFEEQFRTLLITIEADQPPLWLNLPLKQSRH